MSHRVTTRTEIKDKDLAIQALTKAGFGYDEDGTLIHVTSGPMRNATIDLRTGNVQGDSDYSHTENKLGALRKFYTEAKFRKEALKQGITIESREVLANGQIKLICQAQFA